MNTATPKPANPQTLTQIQTQTHAYAHTHTHHTSNHNHSTTWQKTDFLTAASRCTNGTLPHMIYTAIYNGVNGDGLQTTGKTVLALSKALET